jgi:hypothetical protein
MSRYDARIVKQLRPRRLALELTPIDVEHGAAQAAAGERPEQRVLVDDLTAAESRPVPCRAADTITPRTH